MKHGRYSTYTYHACRCDDCKKANRDYKRKKRAENGPKEYMQHQLKQLYGVTWDQYIQMLEEQNHSCKICGEKCETFNNLSVDHDHVTGAIRGLLCAACNRGLSCFRDDVDKLRKAIGYLEQHTMSKV